MDCETCKEKRKVISQTHKDVPYYAYEVALARLNLVIKRLYKLIVLLIILLVASNAAWLYYESSFEEIRIEQENESGYNNFIGNDGDIHNGETDNNNP